MSENCQKNAKTVSFYHLPKVYEAAFYFFDGRIIIRNMNFWRSSLIHECGHAEGYNHGINLENYERRY